MKKDRKVICRNKNIFLNIVFTFIEYGDSFLNLFLRHEERIVGNVSIYLWETFSRHKWKRGESENSDMVGSEIHIKGK